MTPTDRQTDRQTDIAISRAPMELKMAELPPDAPEPTPSDASDKKKLMQPKMSPEIA